MYIWKCWRDTRGAFISTCVILFAVVAFHAAVTLDYASWAPARGPSALLWRATAAAIGELVRALVMLTGFAFGACGLGEEFHRGTVPFLLARPRSRGYFVWTGWAMGAAQLALLVPLGYLVSAQFGTRWLQRDAVWQAATSAVPLKWPEAEAWKMILAIYIMALVFYSLTYFTTLLMRGARNGMNTAVLVVCAYFGIAVLLYGVWQKELPVVWRMLGELSRPPFAFPTASAAGWLAVALAFPVLSHWIFRRAEV